MPFLSTKAPRLTCTAGLAALCLIGWAARATLAQDPAIAPIPSGGSGSQIVDQGFSREGEDPEKAAIAFLESNQKMAESQLHSLRAEEAKLRARLQKVEAGIKRWDSLLGALEQSQRGASWAGSNPTRSGSIKSPSSSSIRSFLKSNRLRCRARNDLAERIQAAWTDDSKLLVAS
jgi:hypothetical protein